MMGVMRQTRVLALVVAVCLGCTDAASDTAGDMMSQVAPDAPPDTVSDASADAPADAAVEVDAGPPGFCESQGLRARAFEPGGAADVDFGELMPDFSADSLSGPFRLSDVWSGCDVTLVIPYFGGSGAGDFLWQTPIDALVDESPPNARYVFVSMRSLGEEAQAAADIQRMADRILTHLETKDPETVAHWRGRFHFLTTPGDVIPWLRRIFSAYRYPLVELLAIDRFQTLREGGSMSRVQASGDWPPFLEHAPYTVTYFNYLEQLRQELADQEALGEDILVVRFFDGALADGQIHAVDLPPAAEMERFDHLDIVQREDCGGQHPFFDTCGAWDVSVRVEHCGAGPEAEACLGDNAQVPELFRYLTAYHAGGWWKRDISRLMPRFASGGRHWLRVGQGNGNGAGDYQGWIELRFMDLDEGDIKPRAAVPIRIGSGGLDEVHNERWPDIEFTVPAGTTRVGIYTLVTGHGHVDTGNWQSCSEFCSHEHTVTIPATGGTDHFKRFDMFPYDDCANRVDQGVTANQAGTWYLDRGSWCPGFPAERWEDDLTGAVDLEGTNTLRWTGSYEGGWGPGGGLQVRPWLVFEGTQPGEATARPLPRAACSLGEATAVFRDFSTSHPDFGDVIAAFKALPNGPEKDAAKGVVRGAVASTLVADADGAYKPVFAWVDGHPFSDAAAFDQWFRDVDGVNHRVEDPVPWWRSRRGTGFYMEVPSSYVEAPLVPADFGWGHEGITANDTSKVPQPINMSFTFEVVSTLAYQGGERLRYGHSSDLWVFLDHQLVVDLGGTFRGKQNRIVDVDEVAEALGLEVGETYGLHVFGAVRDGTPNLHLELGGCQIE